MKVENGEAKELFDYEQTLENIKINQECRSEEQMALAITKICTYS